MRTGTYIRGRRACTILHKSRYRQGFHVLLVRNSTTLKLYLPADIIQANINLVSDSRVYEDLGSTKSAGQIRLLSHILSYLVHDCLAQSLVTQDLDQNTPEMVAQMAQRMSTYSIRTSAHDS